MEDLVDFPVCGSVSVSFLIKIRTFCACKAHVQAYHRRIGVCCYIFVYMWDLVYISACGFVSDMLVKLSCVSLS